MDIQNDGTTNAPITGHIDVGFEPKPLALNAPYTLTRSVVIRASGEGEPGPGEGGGNSAIVFLGGPNVRAAYADGGGIPLLPGESYTLPCRDLSKVWVVAASEGQHVSWCGV